MSRINFQATVSNIEFRIDWSRKSHEYTDEEIQAITGFLRTADTFTQGVCLETFEKDFAAYCGVDHAFAMANCTCAIEIAASLMNLAPGDEVIVPAHTWCSTAIPFIRAGAKIIWADIDPDTRLITAETIRKALTLKTKAIVVVHLYGLMAEMPEIMELAEKHGVYVLEDCAQALGAEFKGRKAGTYGDFATFSFHTQKNMTTLGEGGVLCVRDLSQARRVRGLIHNAVEAFEDQKEYWIPAMSNVVLDQAGKIPYNFCLTEIQSFVGSLLLKRIDQLNDARIDRAKRFKKAFLEFDELSFQKVPVGNRHVFHLLTARYDGSRYRKNRDDLIRHLAYEHKVKAIVQYFPLYRYPFFKDLGFGSANCPDTDYFFDNMVSFPFQVWMSEDDFAYLINAVKKSLLTLRQG